MAQRLKRWESPRREGRNDKGRGGSARQRQKQKQMKQMRQRLKDGNIAHQNGEDHAVFPVFNELEQRLWA